MDSRTEEFISLVKASGWSQAEVARRLHITPGAVSQICNGHTRPRPGTVNLLKMLIGPQALKVHEQSHAKTLTRSENQLLQALSEFTERDREKLLAAFQQTIKAVRGAARRGAG